MDSSREYYVYDFARDRVASEFEAEDDLGALSEFTVWYNLLVRPARWEKRSLGRYWLYERRHDADGGLLPPRPVSVDENIRLDRHFFWLASPPHDEASERALWEWFERLDAADLARLQSRGNSFAEYLDYGRSKPS